MSFYLIDRTIDGKCTFCASVEVVRYIGPGDAEYVYLDTFDVRGSQLFHDLHAEGKDVCFKCLKKKASGEVAAWIKSLARK